MALTAEQTTAQNFKDFYDRIRPLLNAQHYHVDRSGQELKCGDYNIQGNPTIPVGLSQNTHLTLTARGGQHPANFTIENGNIIIPEGMTVNIASNMVVNNNGSESETNSLFMIYDYKNSANIGYASAVYHGNGVARTGSYIYNYTAPSGGAEIGLKCTYNAVAARTIGGESGLTITEVGRIVDPVQYVSSGDNLEETPVGNIISYMGNNVPKHYLACDGHEYPIGSYPELEAHFIAEFGSVNYFGGDGTSNWAVPDLRGEFLRGTGTNSHTNQGAGENVGIHQDGTATPSVSAGYDGLYINNIPASGTNGSDNIDSGYKKNVSNRSASVNIAGTWSTTANNMVTSRPTNTSVQYCIKYETTYHVIVPSHAYKCEATYGLTYNSGGKCYDSYSMTCTAGDASMIDGNYFVAPIDGWYSVSFKSSQVAYTNTSVQYILINNNAFADGTGSGTNHTHFGINMTDTIYLSKGDKVNYRVYTNANTLTLPDTRSASFCLLTSNYNPTIVSADSVYSENEQMIGYWTDGKPLYQKTISTTAPEVATEGTTKTRNIPINVSVETFVLGNGIIYLANGVDTTIPSVTTEINNRVWIRMFNSTFTDLPNHIQLASTTPIYNNQPVNITIRYTKTTDTASTLQIENSLLLNRPDLWTVGTEYHFGGGLYGQRLVSTSSITITAKQHKDIPVLSGISRIMSSGGMFTGIDTSSNNFSCQVPSTYDTSWSTGFYIDQNSSPNQLKYWFKNDNTSSITILSYDVWVTYKK